MTATNRPPFDSVSVQAAKDVVAALRASNLARANDLASAAILRGLRHPALFNARALWSQAQGRIEDALADFRQTLGWVPDDANLLVSIGRCLLALGRAPDAVATFEAAMALRPDLAAAHHLMADALAATGNARAAQDAYERAIAIEPSDATALASLATLAARRREWEKARDYANKCLALRPGNAAAIVSLATIEIQERDFASAERRLRVLLAGSLDFAERAAVLSVLGDALDGCGRTNEAFAAYSDANAELRRAYAPKFGRARAIHAANALIAHFEVAAAEVWQAPCLVERAIHVPRRHVFLLGFMRSGTTLLEQALASHPQVMTIGEQDFLRDANRTFLTSLEGIGRLANLGGDEVLRWRDAYWKSVRAFGVEPEDQVFVDKLPFNTVKLPIIAKLFPTARILFCVRDPRDVVFSSFRRPFDVNATIFECLALEDGARFYSAIMRLARIYRNKLPLTVLEHRYESMIESFEASVTAVCDFIGIEWTDSMREFAETAKMSDIRNPSAPQVRRPLFLEGVGQWRRYREHLAPALPLLAPWVARFGYAAD